MRSVYRPSRNQPQTAWARHLDRVMQDRGWSRVQLFENVGAELGYGPKSRAAMLPLLIDKEPTADQASILRKHFGEPEAIPLAPREEGGDQPAVTAALIASLTAQTEALNRLAAAIEQQPNASEVLLALGALADVQAGQSGRILTLEEAIAARFDVALREGRVPPAPHGTKG